MSSIRPRPFMLSTQAAKKWALLTSQMTEIKKKKKKKISLCLCCHLPLSPLLATDSSGCEDTVPRCVCARARTHMRTPLGVIPPSLPKHLLLFIYLFLSDNGGDRVSGRMPADDTSPGLILPANPCQPFLPEKFHFFQKEAMSVKQNPNPISRHFLLSLSSPPGGAMEGAHSAATQCLNPIYSFSWRDNYSPETS